MRENTVTTRSKDKMEAALFNLLKTQPYRRITVGAIAKEAGFSRQTFYLNFADKDDVLARCLLRLLDKILARVQAEKVANVEGLVSVYTTIVEENAEFLKILADNDLAGLVSRLYSKKLMELPPVLAGQRANQTETERKYFNLFWVSAFVEVYTLWLTEGMRADRKEINRIITDIMLGNYFRVCGK